MRKLRYRDIGTLAEGLTASKVWRRDPNLVGRAQEPRAQATMLSFLEDSEYFHVEWSLPWVLIFRKINGKDGEILNGWKINSKSLQGLLYHLK